VFAVAGPEFADAVVGPDIEVVTLATGHRPGRIGVRPQ
jgi:hypothetical protein